jgi:carbon storage regulator
MLVLSRKRGQQIVIGDNITITVVEVINDKVRIGISAPRSLPVFRRELLGNNPPCNPDKGEPSSPHPPE